MNNTVTTSTTEQMQSPAVPGTAWDTLQKEARWLTASAEERAVLERIARQRDRRYAAHQARLQAKELASVPQAVPTEAPFMERLMVFAKLHPVATAAVGAVALMIGPRKLLRVGAMALPIVTKLRR